MANWPNIVYVIDDEAHVLRALARLIRSASMELVELSCLRGLLKIPPLDAEECAISDVRMPDESKLTIPRHLAERGTPIPVILVTAIADEETRTKAERVGAAAFLQKPADEGELLSAIAEAAAARSGAQGGSIWHPDDYR